MNSYIATFFTHHDAMVYKRGLDKQAIKSKLMPVPRKLSSSCGTCISFDAQSPTLDELANDITEMIGCCKRDQISIIIDNR